MSTIQNSSNKALIRRYLVWCYKTTKESYDRIERKFTQVLVDEYIYKQLKNSKNQLLTDDKLVYHKELDNFRKYIDQKLHDGLTAKFSNTKKLKGDVQFLKDRLNAIEKAIGYFLGKSEIEKIRNLYEREFTGRILESKEH